MFTKRRQRTGKLAVYKFKNIDDLDLYLMQLRQGVHTMRHAKTHVKEDLDMLLDARLAMMKERDKDVS